MNPAWDEIEKILLTRDKQISVILLKILYRVGVVLLNMRLVHFFSFRFSLKFFNKYYIKFI